MSENETVTISKSILQDLHAIAAGGGAIMEKSLSRDAVILALAVMGIGRERAVEVLDEASAALGRPPLAPESEEQKAVGDLLRSIPEGGTKASSVSELVSIVNTPRVD